MGLFAGAAVAEATDARIRCSPAEPFFCENIHIGCAGRSKLDTLAFTLDRKQVVFDDATRWTVNLADNFLPNEKGDSALVLRHGKDWIRLTADGRFSQRIYRKGKALMTRGTCRNE